MSTEKIKKILPVILLLILGTIAIALFLTNQSDINLATRVYEADRPILISSEDGKYGFISSKGDVIVEPVYSYAEEFLGDYAVVSKESRSRKNIIIDKKGNVKFECRSEATYVPECNMWILDGSLYDSKLNRITPENISVDAPSYYSRDLLSYNYFTYSDDENEECGIIDKEGNIIFSWAGNDISVYLSENEFSDKDLYAIVKTDDRECIVSLAKGKIVYDIKNVTDLKDPGISEDNNNIFKITDGYYYNVKKYLFFANGKLAFESENDFSVVDFDKQIIGFYYGSDYEKLGKKQEYEFYDIKKEKYISDYTLPEIEVEADEEELVVYSKGYDEGLIRGDKVVCKAQYDDIEFLPDGIFSYIKEAKGKEIVILEKDDEIILMDVINNKVEARYKHDYCSTYDSSFVKFYTSGEDEEILYNLLTGKSMTISKDASIKIKSNYFVINEDDKEMYYNTNCKLIYVK